MRWKLLPGTRSIALEHLLFKSQKEAQRWLNIHYPGCTIKVLKDGTAVIFDERHREIAWIRKDRK